MAQTATFRYPGDDPTALGTAATQLDEAATRVDRLTQALTISRARLRDAWTMQAADLADADIGTLMAGLPMVRTALGAAHTALTTHQATLSRIRADIDDLETRFRQQTQVLESVNHDYRQLTATAGDAPSLQVTAALATTNAATAAQEAIWANYLQLLTDADISAQTCMDALTTSWDPSRRASIVTDPGLILLAPTGLSTTGLNLLRINADVAEAGRLGAQLAALDGRDSTDPAAQAMISRLAEIWTAEGDNGIFATEFYNRLGADDAVNLMAAIATTIPPGRQGESGSITPALIGDLQCRLANGLARATTGIEFAGDSLQDVVPGGLGVDWVQHLMAKGHSEIFVPFNGNLLQRRGYLPLMATLAAGGGYSAGLLQALGDDMRAVELTEAAQWDNEFGDSVWGRDGREYWDSSTPPAVRWNWSATDLNSPLGNDPFTSWTTAALHSRGAATSVMARDPDLLSHLLNGRNWSIPDGSDQPNAGLTALGSSLPLIIGSGQRSPDAAAAFDNVVRVLGNTGSNPRINSGDFDSTDYIRPELRPGLGTFTEMNIDLVNEAFRTNPPVPYSRYLADVVKDPSIDADGHDLLDRLLAAEVTHIGDLQTSNHFSAVDLDAQSRIAATLTHGSGAADVAAQAAADEAHNSQVRPLAAAANLVWDTLSTKLKWSKESFKFFGGNEIDGVFAGLMEDHAVEARNAAADSTGGVIAQASEAAGIQTYAERQQAIPLPGPDQGITLFDAADRRLSWTELDIHAQTWVLDHWSAGPRDLPNPESASSNATNAFGAQKGMLLDILRPETPK